MNGTSWPFCVCRRIFFLVRHMATPDQIVNHSLLVFTNFPGPPDKEGKKALYFLFFFSTTIMCNVLFIILYSYLVFVFVYQKKKSTCIYKMQFKYEKTVNSRKTILEEKIKNIIGRKERNRER